MSVADRVKVLTYQVFRFHPLFESQPAVALLLQILAEFCVQAESWDYDCPLRTLVEACRQKVTQMNCPTPDQQEALDAAFGQGMEEALRFLRDEQYLIYTDDTSSCRFNQILLLRVL